MLQEFKKFIMKGNLVEIAVGLILALKFTDVVNALVDGIISPLIGAIFGESSFREKTFEVGEGVVLYGSFIDAVIAFVIVGFVLFLIVKAYNTAKERFTKAADPEAVPDDIALLREIRDAVQARNIQQ